ncbi:MAG: DMT family transporter [SAR324 cluster bacterium]|nr:DMT family transporter [SAR324 cluster bacterium]MDP6745240.1 DMT family transporter [SAR324 cluster bacterium]MEC7888061.1 DMT family transporter [SAR324 cluster bacterium]MEC8981131.1 DMT family transporter [SAR324 cluster bacterium]MEC9011809.1 DMT family transporter [SAR324 cluster bacterium]
MSYFSSASQNALLYVVTVLIWGSSWLAIKYQLGSVDPMVSVAYRFMFASALSWLYCRFSGRLMRYSLRDHGFMFLQGASLFALNYWLFYLSEITLTSGLAAVIFSTIVVMNMMNGVLFLKNRLELRVVLGAGIGLFGIIVVFWPEVTDFESGSENLFAVSLAVLATLLASLGNIASARNQRKGIPVVQANTFGMTYGALLMLVLSWVTGREFTFEVTLPYVSSLVFLSVFASIVAFWTYLTLLGRVGVERAAYATLFFPLVALGFSTVFEDYQWTASAGIGILLILAGNLLILKRSA